MRTKRLWQHLWLQKTAGVQSLGKHLASEKLATFLTMAERFYWLLPARDSHSVQQCVVCSADTMQEGFGACTCTCACARTQGVAHRSRSLPLTRQHPPSITDAAFCNNFFAAVHFERRPAGRPPEAAVDARVCARARARARAPVCA